MTLLIPAFALPSAPPVLAVRLLCRWNAPLPPRFPPCLRKARKPDPRALVGRGDEGGRESLVAFTADPHCSCVTTLVSCRVGATFACSPSSDLVSHRLPALRGGYPATFYRLPGSCYERHAIWPHP